MTNKAEDLKLDSSLDVLIHKSNDIKSSLNQFLWKLNHQHETLTWPSVLDSFALLSSQINSFQKALINEKTVPLKSFVFVPLILSQDRDIELEKLTEGRVPVFNHEIVPDYLRTKPEIDVEKKIKQCSDKVTSQSNEAITKQINSFNKICSALSTAIQNKREDLKDDDNSRRFTDTSLHSETVALVAATSQGKGLIEQRAQIQMMRPEMAPTPHQMMHPKAPTPNINIGGPGKIKPNIRMPSYTPY